MRFVLVVWCSMAMLCMATSAVAAEPAWTTYHRDAERTGSDPDGTSPLTPTLAWQSPDLGAPIWGQPLILGGRAYVTTVGDGVYALDVSTGQVIWHVSAGTPVPSSALPCGDIEPSVGIVGTPMIDRTNGVLYAVADTWDGSHAQHLLEGFRISDGTKVLSTVVDPPGTDPKATLQRPGLNLDGSNVIVGFGGNDGDCANYKGTVASVPESGAAPTFWEVPIAAPATTGGAVWATGGPAVDGSGEIYASTGNPNPSGGEATTYDYSDSVVQLNPSLSLTGHFEPPSWQSDSNSDRDLASGSPELLPGGVVFEAGKNGTGYLIDEATMGGGATAVYSGQVCGGAGSFGGDSYAGGVIYLPCTNGMQALSYNEGARTFTPLWKGPADAFGSPILSAGLVWVVATGGFVGGGTKLYGLEPAGGKARYTETLPSPVADHFASPSAAGGRLMVATGSTVSAFQIAVLTPLEGPPLASTAPNPAPSGGTPLSVARLAVLVHSHLRANARGQVRVVLRCPALIACRGTVTMKATLSVVVGHGSHRHRRMVHVRIAGASFGSHRGQFTLTLRLGKGARALLRGHHRLLHVTLTIVLPGISTRKVDALLRG
jgi:outer membrane protein assembly factor BamB